MQFIQNGFGKMTVAASALILSVSIVALQPVSAFAQYDDGVYGSDATYGSSDYDSGYDSGTYGSGVDYGSNNYDGGYDSGVYGSGLNYGSTNYEGGYDSGTYGSGLNSGSNEYANSGYDSGVYGSGLNYGSNDLDGYNFAADGTECYGNCGNNFAADTGNFAADSGNFAADTGNFAADADTGNFAADADTGNFAADDTGNFAADDCGCVTENGVRYSAPTSYGSTGSGYRSTGYSTGYGSTGYSISAPVGPIATSFPLVSGGTIAASVPLVAPTPTYHTTYASPIVTGVQTPVYQAPVQTTPTIVNTNTNTNVNTSAPVPVVMTQAPVRTASVSLNQIPYTGFDFGTVGNAIYWTLLASFAIAAGYLFVYYKGGMVTLATVVAGRKQFQPMKFVDAVEAPVTAPAIAAPAAKILSERVIGDRMSFATAQNGMPTLVINRN